MTARWLRSIFATIVVIALIALPVFALRLAPQPSDAPDLPAPGAEQVDEGQQPEDDGVGNCHGIQRAYWAVNNNPGDGEGQAEAAAGLEAKAAERGCELTAAPPDGWPGGGPPPWAGNDDGAEGRGNGNSQGQGLGRPKWAAEGDGPPWGPPPWAGGDEDD